MCADMIAPEGYGEIIGGSNGFDDPRVDGAAFQGARAFQKDAYQWYAICVNTALCRIPALVWVLNVRLLGFAA